MTTVSRRAVLAALGGTLGTSSGCIDISRSDREMTSTGMQSETPQPSKTGARPADHCEPYNVTNDGPLAVEQNSRAIFQCAGDLLDGMESLGPWKTYDGHLESDERTAAGGARSARLTTEPDGDRVWIYRRFEPPLDLTSHDLSLAIHPGGGRTKARMIRAQVLAPDYQNRIDMRHGVGKLGGWFRMDLGPTVIKGTPELHDVRELRIQSLSHSRSRLRLNVDELRLVPKADRGRVMLTFDDGPVSQYMNAFPVMKEHGFPGVAGVIPWLTSDPDYLGPTQLEEMQSAGWDIVSHPQLTDPSRPLPTLPVAEQRRAIERSKRWLLQNGFERGARFVIWPFHAAGAHTLELGSEYHSLGFAGGLSPSGIPPTDPLTIGRVDGESATVAEKMVRFAAQYNQMAVIMYHEVGNGSLSMADFKRTLQVIDDADVDVITASDLWATMTRSPPASNR